MGKCVGEESMQKKPVGKYDKVGECEKKIKIKIPKAGEGAVKKKPSVLLAKET